MSDKYPSLSPYAYCAWNPLRLIDPDGRDWYETDDGEVKWTKYHSQKEMKDNNLKGKYLGQAYVIFQGSRSESLGKGGNIFGEGARTANVTVYGPGGENDITQLTGFTMTSDYSKHSAIAEGLYNANYDIAGKSGSLKSNFSVRVIRTQQEYTPLMGVTGPVPNMNIVQKITRK